MRKVDISTKDSHTRITISDGDYVNDIVLQHQLIPAELARQFANAVMNLPHVARSENKGQ